MKILHLCLANVYIDNHSYQENMLTKYHKYLGFNVEIIASLLCFNLDGELYELDKGSNYYNEHDIKVTRLEYRNEIFSRRLRIYKNTYKEIIKSSPDIIFIHGCQFLDIRYVVKYAKINPNVKIYVDNHADFNNSGKNFLSKNLLHKLLWRKCANLIEPYTKRFYGVLPARVDFLINIYKIPKDKVELLVMGVDDEKINELKKNESAVKLRRQLEIDSDEFIIVTGGKIDSNKTQIFNLMEVVKKMNNSNVRLVIFGSVTPEYKEQFNSLLNDKINYVGWVNTTQIYEYFNIADLIVFPGLHSVLWEQAVGFGKPCVFKYIDGFTHIDLGGNCKFFYEDSTYEMKRVINEIVNNNEIYENMKDIANNKAGNIFSYKEIAKRSIL